MYQVGDQIVYGTMGVCQVTDIALRSLSGSGEKRPYYTLKPLYQDCLIHVPVDTTASIRPAIGRRQAEALIDSIPTIHPTPFHSRIPSQVSEHYAEALRSHDCAQLVGLTMSIYAKKQEAENGWSATDRRTEFVSWCFLPFFAHFPGCLHFKHTIFYSSGAKGKFPFSKVFRGILTILPRLEFVHLSTLLFGAREKKDAPEAANQAASRASAVSKASVVSYSWEEARASSTRAAAWATSRGQGRSS